MTKRDLKVKHLKTMIAIAKALNVGNQIGQANLSLSGPGLKKKFKNISEWSIQQIKINESKNKALIKENDHFAAQLEEKNFKLSFLEEQVRQLGVDPEFLYKHGLDSHGQPKPDNKEVNIKFDMPAQINSNFKSDDSLLEKAKEPFTKRTEKTEVEPATFNKETISLKAQILKLENELERLRNKIYPVPYNYNNVSEIPISDFKKTGLLLLVNQVLHAFGIAIVVEYFKDEPNMPVRMFPARVKFRGFAGEEVYEAYENIGLYLNNNAKLIYNETDDDHDFQPEKTQF